MIFDTTKQVQFKKRRYVAQESIVQRVCTAPAQLHVFFHTNAVFSS
jgi:hypothetical protein